MRNLLAVSFCFTLLSSLISGSCARADEASEKRNAWKADYEAKVLPIIRAKCLECHRGEKTEGEFDLSKYLDGDAAVEAGDAWERVARRVRLNEMPPKDSPGLTDPEKSAFHRWVDSRPGQDLCRQLASDETQSWYRGHVMSRRLTRTEYANAIRDTIGVTVSTNELPPSDGAGGEGFDTVGDTLFTSTIHLEKYLAIADRGIDLLLNSSQTPAEIDAALARSGSLLKMVWPVSNSDESGQRERELVAVRETLAAFAKLAWRRPPSQDELSRLADLFSKNRDRKRNFIESIREPLKAILVSPHFLFVVESEPIEPGVQRLTSYQLAMRVSLLLWSSIPDVELMRCADDASIYDDAVLMAQVKRMLSDPRSRALGENFGLQWLGLRDFLDAVPDKTVFPEYEAALAHDMLEEPIQFVTGVFRDDRPLTDLIQSDYTFLNPRLASHYGWDIPGEDVWQRVPVSDPRRGGVITMASVLTRSSYPRRTSPVLRGRWVLEEVLGAAVPPPPPNVPALDESNGAANAMTLRARLEAHRLKAECASCHDRMDPLGFGLENFDAIGRWREMDAGMPIDARGTLPSGENFSGPQELKSIVLKRSDEFKRHFVRKLLGFALGRELNKFDACVVDACLKRLAAENDRSGVVVEEIVLSYPFQYRYYKSSADKQADAPK